MAPWTITVGSQCPSLVDCNDKVRIEAEPPHQVDALNNISLVQIVASRNASFALTVQGKVLFWGDAFGGMAGNDDEKFRKDPIVVNTHAHVIKQLASFDDSVVALTDQGEVMGWGWFVDHEGECYRSQASILPDVHKTVGLVKFVASGYHFVAVISADGDVWTWGVNDQGQLGTGSSSAPLHIPQKVEGLTDVVRLACGKSHTLALTRSGEVYSWGRAQEGQLGVLDASTTAFVAKPKQIILKDLVVDEDKIEGIACGSFHSAFWTEGGLLFTWGSKRMNRLGHFEPSSESTTHTTEEPIDASISDESRLLVPQRLKNMPRVLEVSCGVYRTVCLCLKESGKNEGKTYVMHWGGPNHERPEVLDFKKSIEMEALRLWPSHVACGGHHILVHAGPHLRTSFIPALPEAELQIVSDAVHRRLTAATKFNPEVLQNEFRILQKHQDRLKYQREWSDLAYQATKLEAAGRQAEADPLGGAKVKSTSSLFGLLFGVATEPSPTRELNKRKGKGGFIYAENISNQNIPAPKLFETPRAEE